MVVIIFKFDFSILYDLQIVCSTVKRVFNGNVQNNRLIYKSRLNGKCNFGGFSIDVSSGKRLNVMPHTATAILD